mmetsp:Transcript_28402/g.74613  ORF Transcript_28402/g.74613 Transcript_28402/m.74613 type:complete len:333 (-) Transcript_28402:44-1042(-)
MRTTTEPGTNGGAHHPFQPDKWILRRTTKVDEEGIADVIPLPLLVCTIGRRPANTIVLTSKSFPKLVSRRHAKLTWEESSGCWQIVDLGSTNGVLVNNRKVASAAVEEGDTISFVRASGKRIGEVLFDRRSQFEYKLERVRGNGVTEHLAAAVAAADSAPVDVDVDSPTTVCTATADAVSPSDAAGADAVLAAMETMPMTAEMSTQAETASPSREDESTDAATPRSLTTPAQSPSMGSHGHDKVGRSRKRGPPQASSPDVASDGDNGEADDLGSPTTESPAKRLRIDTAATTAPSEATDEVSDAGTGPTEAEAEADTPVWRAWFSWFGSLFR